MTRYQPYQYAVAAVIASNAGEVATLEIRPVREPVAVSMLFERDNAGDLSFGVASATRITAALENVTPEVLGLGGNPADLVCQAGRANAQPPVTWPRMNLGSGAVSAVNLSPWIVVPIGSIFSVSLVVTGAASLGLLCHPATP